MKTIINYIKNNVKYLIIAIIILCIVICTPIVLSTIRKNKIENVVNEYINALKLGNYDESLTYLDEEYDYSNNAPLIYYNELIEFYSKFTVDIENIDIKNKYAIVKLKIKTPDIFESTVNAVKIASIIVFLILGFSSHFIRHNISKNKNIVTNISLFILLESIIKLGCVATTAITIGINFSFIFSFNNIKYMIIIDMPEYIAGSMHNPSFATS